MLMGLTSYSKLNHHFNVSHLQYADMRSHPAEILARIVAIQV